MHTRKHAENPLNKSDALVRIVAEHLQLAQPQRLLAHLFLPLGAVEQFQVRWGVPPPRRYRPGKSRC